MPSDKMYRTRWPRLGGATVSRLDAGELRAGLLTRSGTADGEGVRDWYRLEDGNVDGRGPGAVWGRRLRRRAVAEYGPDERDIDGSDGRREGNVSATVR